MKLFLSNIIAILCAIALVPALGCATWDAPASYQEWQLPAPKSDSESVVLEFAFIRWPQERPKGAASASLSDLPESDDLWRSIDEQFLSPELRQHLSSNGLRAGVLSDPLPDAIRAGLESTRNPLAVISQQDATPGEEVLTRRERRQCSGNQRQEIEVLPLREESCVVLSHELGRVRAQRFERPRGFLRMNAHAMGDGRVQVELTPAIDYGEPKQQVIGGQGAYRYHTKRDECAFDTMSISTALPRGRTLVLTSSDEPKGVGAIFFANRFKSNSDKLLLLLRIAESQEHELFSPQNDRESIVTPLN